MSLYDILHLLKDFDQLKLHRSNTFVARNVVAG